MTLPSATTPTSSGRPVQPGYHMNKKHWNTVSLDGSIPAAEIAAMIDQSYDLVVGGLKKADRKKLQESG